MYNKIYLVSQPENRGEDIEAFAIGFYLHPNPFKKLPMYTINNIVLLLVELVYQVYYQKENI